MKFTHDLNDDADIGEYGYPGAMLYARPSFAGGLSPVFRLAPSDALVVVLCTHRPETRYFGLSTSRCVPWSSSFRRLAWYLLHVETHLSTVGRFVRGTHRSIDPS